MNSMKLKTTFLLSISFIICQFLTFCQKSQTPDIYLEPIYKVNYGDATADKPQSKSWSNTHGQWLIVGDEDGPKLLKKDAVGWTSQTAVNKEWLGLPSRADVWSKGDVAHLVLVEECALEVVQISYNEQNKSYEHQWKVSLPIPEDCQSIETATITQDTKNEFWVCADMNEKVMVWHSTNGKTWSAPITLADDINGDDISLVVSLKNQVSVIWSNQNTESINERIHIDGDAPNQWSELIIVQKGDNNADDHINATVFENGELALVSKNSVDKKGEPQFVFRLRDTNGNWTNIPYENLSKDRSPSRPIINHVASGKTFEVHTVKNKATDRYYMSVNEIVKSNEGWKFTELVQLKTKINGKNGDATSSKASFVENEPKLIFFSDNLGNVYAFDLDSLF